MPRCEHKSTVWSTLPPSPPSDHHAIRHTPPTKPSGQTLNTPLVHTKRPRSSASGWYKLVQSESLPAVCVLPTAPIGPLDLKPTPTGRLIRDAALGQMPAYIRSAGLNIVHVSDVATGHLLAAEQIQRGHVGERFLLGHPEGNLTLREIITHAAAAGGVDPPQLALPLGVAYLAAVIDEYLISELRRQTPRATIAGVRLAAHRQWFDPGKAIRELKLPQTPLEQTFEDAAAWFLADQAR